MADPLDAERWQDKRAMLNAPHMEPLTTLVRHIRAQRLEAVVPNFDPDDGGINAEALFVLEAPGPKAVVTGFVSRDNPDQTARNLKQYLMEAGIDRKRSLIWNIVPWYIGDAGKIRPATPTDIRVGSIDLDRLLLLLPRLRAVVLVGRKAQAAFKTGDLTTALPTYHSAHPSPQWVHRHPDNQAQIVTAFREVAAHLDA